MNGGSKDDLIYKQDCEFLREYGRLHWSRLRTVAIAETAFLYAYFIMNNDITHGERLLLAFAGTVIVFVLSFLPFIDQKYYDSFKDRIISYEGQQRRFNPKLLFGFLKGRHLMATLIVFLNLFNFCLILMLLCCCKCQKTLLILN